jgi:hypothetical protein
VQNSQSNLRLLNRSKSHETRRDETNSSELEQLRITRPIKVLNRHFYRVSISFLDRRPKSVGKPASCRVHISPKLCEEDRSREELRLEGAYIRTPDNSHTEYATSRSDRSAPSSSDEKRPKSQNLPKIYGLNSDVSSPSPSRFDPNPILRTLRPQAARVRCAVRGNC